MRILNIALLSAAIGLGLSAEPALAQSDTLVVSGSSLDVMSASQTQARVAELEKAYNDVHLAGPRAGVGMSAILVVGGIMMVVTGAALTNFDRSFLCSPETAPCRSASAAGPATLVSGVAVMAGGITGVVLMNRKLKQKKKEQRRIARQINTLKRSVPPESGGS